MDWLHPKGFSKLAAALNAKLSDNAPALRPARQYSADCSPDPICLLLVGRKCFLYTDECPGLAINRDQAVRWLWLIRDMKRRGVKTARVAA